MIQKLKIQNFQSHKDSALEFHPGVNVIVGASDSGKTAILRALRWLIWNRPNGEDFRSDWGGETDVVLEIEDDVKILRRKGKENLYTIGRSAQDHKELKAFGTSVPEEIQKALNIDDTNLQKQFDSPFLISSSPGEVAGYFNQIAHLERIDSSVSYVNGKILSLGAKQKADESYKKEYQTELKQYDYIDKFEIDLESLEHQHSNYIQTITSRTKLKFHLETIEENAVELRKQEQIIKFDAPVEEILTMYVERRVLEMDKKALKCTLRDLGEYEIITLQLSRLTSLAPQVDELLELKKEKLELEKNHHRLRNAMVDAQVVSKEQLQQEILAEEKEAKFHKYMPEICPLCGRSDP